LIVRALKYGRLPHYEWETTLLERRGDVLCRGELGRRFTHHTRGFEIHDSTPAVEFFSLSQWFTVSANVRDVAITDYYCNIAEPAQFADDVLTFVDLDLDLVRRGAGEWHVVDEEELAHNAARFGYPPDLVMRARVEMQRLRARITARRFPFDGTLDRRAATRELPIV